MCEIVGSGSPVSTRTPEDCGSSDPPVSSRTRLNSRFQSSSASRPIGIRANAAFFRRSGLFQARRFRPTGTRCTQDHRRDRKPSARGDGPRRRRIAGRAARAAWRGVAPQPAAAGALDGPARGGRDDDRLGRLVGGVGDLQHDEDDHDAALVWGMVCRSRRRHCDRVSCRSAVTGLCRTLCGDRGGRLRVFQSISAPGVWLQPDSFCW